MWWPVPSLNAATTIRIVTPAMNAYVGIANAVPDSRTPRRFSSVMMITMVTASTTA